MGLSDLLATWAGELTDAWPLKLISYGEQGVLYTDGAIQDEPLTDTTGFRFVPHWPFTARGGGWHLLVPFRQTLELQSTLLQVETLEWQRCELKDRTSVTFSVCARYRVVDAVALYKTVDEPETAISDAIRTGTAQAALSTPEVVDLMDGTFKARATKRARAVMEGWGVELQPVRLTNAVEAPMLSLIHDSGGESPGE